MSDKGFLGVYIYSMVWSVCDSLSMFIFPSVLYTWIKLILMPSAQDHIDMRQGDQAASLDGKADTTTQHRPQITERGCYLITTSLSLMEISSLKMSRKTKPESSVGSPICKYYCPLLKSFM